jgi:hypothetical protein
MTNSPVLEDTIYFIYIGDQLPRYGQASLALARSTSNSEIHLIGNSTMRQSAKNEGVGFTSIEEFYDDTKFKRASQNVLSDSSFRSGFWFKSIERLFILEQFARESKFESIWHAELDQILVNSRELVQSLRKTERKGLFMPFHNKDAVVASLIYVNDLGALSSLTDFACNAESINNEMQLMAKWSARNPKRAFALPTLATEFCDKASIIPDGVTLLSLDETKGFVDAAQLGQWVAGIDPRNIPLGLPPTTRFIDSPTPALLDINMMEAIEFNLSEKPSSLTLCVQGKEYPLYNLHLHSKCHPQIVRSNPSLKQLLEKSNKQISYRISGMRQIQIMSYIEKILAVLKSDPKRALREVKWRLKHKLRIRPSSYPFLSGDTLRSISHHKWENNSKTIRPGDIKAGDIVFCESELLQELNSQVLSKSEENIILLLGNSDQNHTNSYIASINPPINAKVFAQNLVEAIPNFMPLPIGLENAWRSNHGIIDIKKTKRLSSDNRVPRILSGFNISTNPEVRSKARNTLRTFDVVDEIRNVTPSEHQRLLGSYAFVVSPPGNGLDTHRTWEALYFKCIPIVLKSHMTEFFGSIGIPMWVVESYDELSAQTEQTLGEKYDRLKNYFENEAIWAKYWIDQILLSSRAIIEGNQ